MLYLIYGSPPIILVYRHTTYWAFAWSAELQRPRQPIDVFSTGSEKETVFARNLLRNLSCSSNSKYFKQNLEGDIPYLCFWCYLKVKSKAICMFLCVFLTFDRREFWKSIVRRISMDLKKSRKRKIRKQTSPILWTQTTDCLYEIQSLYYKAGMLL